MLGLFGFANNNIRDATPNEILQLCSQFHRAGHNGLLLVTAVQGTQETLQLGAGSPPNLFVLFEPSNSKALVLRVTGRKGLLVALP